MCDNLANQNMASRLLSPNSIVYRCNILVLDYIVGFHIENIVDDSTGWWPCFISFDLYNTYILMTSKIVKPIRKCRAFSFFLVVVTTCKLNSTTLSIKIPSLFLTIQPRSRSVFPFNNTFELSTWRSLHLTSAHPSYGDSFGG